MRDCPSRSARHPVLTPTFHHVVRIRRSCGWDGCVVPTCPRNRFHVADETIAWTEAPASGDARVTWRCTHCRRTNSTWAA